MDAKDLWQLFLDTGAPEVYLMYNKAKNMEEDRVFNDEGTGASSHSLQ